MSTPLQTVYDAFLARLLEDEWEGWDNELVQEDLRMLLDMAIFRFKFPRVDLNIEDGASTFVGKLGMAEIQILAAFMKCDWYNRTIMRWEHLKPLYHESDFSQANLIDKLTKLLVVERRYTAKLEEDYYRSVNHKPFDYSKLAGDKNGR